MPLARQEALVGVGLLVNQGVKHVDQGAPQLERVERDPAILVGAREVVRRLECDGWRGELEGIRHLRAHGLTELLSHLQALIGTQALPGRRRLHRGADRHARLPEGRG
ncbi:hypothetical protein D3C87_1717980 [compost metagenome]